jgi:hypothetical protein
VKNHIWYYPIGQFGIFLKSFSPTFICEFMPRTDNKSTTKKYSPWPNVLRFVASLLFLFVLFGGTTAIASTISGGTSGWWSPLVAPGTAGALWLPILFGVAVLSSIALFFGSIAGMVWKMSSRGMGWKTTLLASFSLTALTVSPTWSGVFWVVIVGFIVGWIATAMEWM